MHKSGSNLAFARRVLPFFSRRSISSLGGNYRRSTAPSLLHLALSCFIYYTRGQFSHAWRGPRSCMTLKILWVCARAEAAVLRPRGLAASLPRSYFVGLLWLSFARRPISISPRSLWTCSIDSSDWCRRANHAGEPQGREGNLSRALFLHGGSHGRRLATTSSWHSHTPSHAQTTGISAPAHRKSSRSRVAGRRYSNARCRPP